MIFLSNAMTMSDDIAAVMTPIMNLSSNLVIIGDDGLET